MKKKQIENWRITVDLPVNVAVDMHAEDMIRSIMEDFPDDAKLVEWGTSGKSVSLTPEDADWARCVLSGAVEEWKCAINSDEGDDDSRRSNRFDIAKTKPVIAALNRQLKQPPTNSARLVNQVPYCDVCGVQLECPDEDLHYRQVPYCDVCGVQLECPDKDLHYRFEYEGEESADG